MHDGDALVIQQWSGSGIGERREPCGSVAVCEPQVWVRRDERRRRRGDNTSAALHRPSDHPAFIGVRFGRAKMGAGAMTQCAAYRERAPPRLSRTHLRRHDKQ